jgi:hypothetical protein
MRNNRLLRIITNPLSKKQNATAQCRQWAPRPGRAGQTFKARMRGADLLKMLNSIRRGTDRWLSLRSCLSANQSQI